MKNSHRMKYSHRAVIDGVIRSFFLLTLVQCGVVSRALAQEGNDGAVKAPLEVVVTAGRGVAQDPLDVPQVISNVSREDLANREYVDVHDVIAQLPNVGGAPNEGNPNFWQEGFTIRGLGAQRVLTLTNGIRQAGQGIGYGGGNLSLYDLFSIEKLEVLRGPSSVLYGTDAIGGVVNVITREPVRRATFGENAGARYVYDGRSNLHRAGYYLDVGDKDYSVVFGGGYVSSGRPNLPDDEAATQGSYRNLSFWGKADYFVSDHTKLRLLADVNRASDVLVTDSQIPLPIAVFGRPGSSQIISSPLYFQFPTYQRSMVGAELVTEKLSGALDELKSGVYWQQIYRRFLRQTAFFPTGSPGFAGPPSFIDPSASITTSEVRTRDRVNTFEWQTQGRLNFAPHSLIAGLDLGYDDSRLPETETQTVVARAGVGRLPVPVSSSVDRLRAEAKQYRVGLYTQDTWTLGDFEVVPGVRLDYYDVEDDQSSFSDDQFGASGSVGAVYHLDRHDSLYANLATGFRAPDLGERFQDGIVNLGVPSRIIGKADLDPERSYSGELGVKRRDGRLTSEFSGFYNHVRDYIGTKTLGLQQGFFTDQYENVGIVNLYGLEGSVKYALTEGWSIFANAGRTWSPQREKVDVRSWVFNYGTEYSLPLFKEFVRKVTFGVLGRTVLKSDQKRVLSGRTKFDAGGFTTVDLKLNLDIGETPLGKASLVSGVRNLFDRSYEEPFFVQTQPGRNAYVGVQVDF